MEATATEIAQWKKTWGRVHEITVDAGDKKLKAYFRHPTLDVILAATSKADLNSGNGATAAGSVLYESLRLKVDPEIEKDDEAKLGCYQRLAGLFKAKTAEIKEL